jgi:hypothetical protein
MSDSVERYDDIGKANEVRVDPSSIDIIRPTKVKVLTKWFVVLGSPSPTQIAIDVKQL